MLGFGKKKKSDPELEATVVLPVGLNDRHSFAAPGIPREYTHPYPSPGDYGAQVYADTVGDELPPIANQTAILVHWLAPPPDKPPQEWSSDRNSVKIAQSQQEVFSTKNPIENASNSTATVNPWLSTPRSPRPTSQMSPSNFRFLRPFDQRWSHTNNGTVGSAASVGQSYPLGGMQPVRNFRNTFRLQPSPRDIENLDIANTKTASVTPAVYVSPQTQSSRWGL